MENKEVQNKISTKKVSYVQKDEISLKGIILTIIKERRLIISIASVVLLVAMMFTFYQMQESKSAKTIVSFNFEGIEEHLNPDKSKFDPYQIATPYILNDVINKLSLEGKISPNTIRSLVEMSPIIPNSILEKEKFMMEKKGETVEFFPNEYVLTVHSSAKHHVNGQLARKIADQIVLSYRDYFNEEYIVQKPVVNKFTTFDASEYDYADTSVIIHAQLEELKAYDLALSELNPDFRSKRTGLTFYEIIQLLNNTDRVDINKLDSMISAYKLTKDNSKLILYYEYLVEELTNKKNKIQGQSQVAKEMLGTIEDSSKSIMESLSAEPENVGDSYFNKLVLDAANSGESLNAIEEKINYYNKEIEELKSGQYVIDYNRNAVLKETDELIESIIKDLNHWMELGNQTADEFYDQHLSNSFYALAPAALEDKSKPLINIVIGIVAGLMLGAFSALFKAYWQKEEGAN